ncbi:hypothetical protein NIES2100_29860 [Calothrix sp. NIES-2100]|uniref:hypothetical protein n=1 Tax=Calothrix sp. NIES-2100 TaxID=1954172 RepID=UPI000B61A638|nr:hypothetical protein NIES2100_29860 [Calothrix sp. NIES-2100]
MIKAMDTINPTGYPIFTPNQVLTKDDLNNLVSYLDGLNRLTRTHLIGMGIVCGLEVQTLDNKAGISISSGYGITSDGFCIQYPAISNQENAETNKIFTHYQDEVKLAKNLFIPSESSQDYYNVRELIPAEKANSQPKKIIPLTALSDYEWQQQVLIILYDWKDEARQQYNQINYDDGGKERNFELRFLLLPKSENLTTPKNNLSAERLLRQGYEREKLPQSWQKFAIQEVLELRNHFFQEFAPQVQRFGYVKYNTYESVDLTKINDYKTFRENYYLICENAIAAIDKAFPKLFWLFSPFFTAFQPKSGNDFSQLKENLEYLFKGIKLENLLDHIKVKEINKEIQTLKSEQLQSTYTLQYFYDYLSLLVAAYYELAEATFDLMDDCTPDTQRFPRFLMLGLVPSPGQATEVYAAPYAYRSHFTQPPIYNSNQVRVKQVRYLYERLLKLCAKDSFYLLPFYNTPIKITPSKDQSAPLSEQAIPYYLHYPNLYQYWNYDAYRKGRSDRHPAYFYPKNDPKENSHVFNDLTYRLDAYNFYRIEGHIGKANGDALKYIQEYRQRYNLAFDVITLKLGSQASLQDLNISGQFDDLEADFSRINDTFQKIWSKYATPKNVFLQTLKQVFFDQPGLTAITSSQLFNPILEIARKPEAYEFVKGDTDKQFRLFVRSETAEIARYVTQTSSTDESLDNFEDLIINFSGLSNDDAINKEKQRIAKEMATCLSLGKITYGLVKDSSSSPVHYHLKLSTEYEVNLPPPAPKTGSPSRKYSIVLLSLNHFAVSVERDNPPIIKQSEFQDFETLYSLLRDVPDTFNTDSYHMGNSNAAEELNYFDIKGLINAYQQRLERLMKLHLFDKFAQQHPGIEHLGGVPKGGTFILVYVDGEDADNLQKIDQDPDGYKEATKRTETIKTDAFLPPSSPNELPAPELISSLEKLLPELQKRKDIVVADFCLPYRCGSDAPAVSYVVARSRPLILLEKTVFCEGDRKMYQFTLEPEGGTVKGEGVVFDKTKQHFQPSSIDQASRDDLAKGLEVAITFAYAVDDTYDTMTVTIYPLPRPNLSITENQNFCYNADAVEITLAEGTPENVELIQVSVNGTQTKTLTPSLYAAVDKQQVKIEALIRSKQTQCENTLTRTVIINPRPVAELSITEGETFCHNATPQEITLAAGTPKTLELIEVTINDTITNTLNPSLYATAGEPQTLIITAQICDRTTKCQNTLTRTVIINPLPSANLSISDGKNFCCNANSVEITLADGTPKTVELIEVTINDTITNTLNPSLYATAGEPQTVIITAQIRDRQTQCQNTLTRTVIINPLPSANLSISDGQNFCCNANSVEIILADGTPKTLELIEVTINDTITNTLNPSLYATAGEPQTVIITAQIRDRQTQCQNTLTSAVTINPLPSANLSISDGQNFCCNANPVEITLANETPKTLELIEVTINDTITNTLNPSLYATAGEPQTVIITAQIRDRQTQCQNTLTRTVIINPLPSANLSISDGQNFCCNANPVEITLADETPKTLELIEVTINDTITNTLNPSLYATAGEPQTLIITALIRDRQTQCENTLTRTVTINPLPVADFQIEIANINAQGFSVRVFNIQPTETSFNFVWEYPDGISNPSNPGNSEFIISYSYDFNKWVASDEKSITLQVNTPPTLGGCSSQPVTKHIAIPFGAVRLSLLNMNNNQEIVLSGDRTFKISDFNADYQYAIAALTVPATVDSVVFTYTAPNDNPKVSRLVNAPYRLPDGWYLSVGKHTIQAQAFRQNNGDMPGLAATVNIWITDSEPKAPTIKPSTPKSAKLLNRLHVLFSDEWG